MSTQQDALRKAREALQVATTPLPEDRQTVLKAITAIDAALASQPAGQGDWCDQCGRTHGKDLPLYCNDCHAALAQPAQAPAVPVAIVGELCEPTRREVIAKGYSVGAYLYAAAPTAQPKQESEE